VNTVGYNQYALNFKSPNFNTSQFDVVNSRELQIDDPGEVQFDSGNMSSYQQKFKNYSRQNTYVSQ